MTNLRTKLAALFSPTRRLTGNQQGPIQPGGALGGRQWVVPRAECQYRRVDLSAVPARQRPAAARLAVSRHAPSPDAATCLAWHGAIAHLWIWPSPLPAAARGEERWIPETLLGAPPLEDGFRLLAQRPGVEGQVWRGGQLASSQWWPQVPDTDAWQRFLRSAGLDPDLAPSPPEPVVLSWSASPWGRSQRGLLVSTDAHERLAWLAVFVVLAMVLGWQLTGLVRWNLATTAMTEQLEATRTAAAPLLAAREQAEQFQADTGQLLQLQSGTSDYALMTQIIQALPEGAQLNGWRREAGKLQVLVQSAESDPRKFVSAFARLPLLADVTATPQADGRIQMAFTLSAEGAREDTK